MVSVVGGAGLNMEQGKTSSLPSALLVCGFLGAGKTTFIVERIKNSGGKTAVLVNEFGDLGIDGTLIRSEGGLDVIELPGGCICCSMKEGLEKSVRSIAQTIGPDVLLIEPSGVAEASEVIKTLTDEALAGVIRLDAVITLIDSSTFLDFSQPDAFGSFFLDQVSNADLIVVNKIDVVSPAELERVAGRIRELNPSALSVETSFCRLEAPLPSGRQKSVRAEGNFGPAMEYASITPGQPISRQQLENFSYALSAGQFGRIFRAKGLIRVADGGMINFQFAGGTISALPFNAEVGSRIVLIGYDLDRKRINGFFANRQESL